MNHFRVKPDTRVNLGEHDARDIGETLEAMNPRPPKVDGVDWKKLRQDLSGS